MDAKRPQALSNAVKTLQKFALEDPAQAVESCSSTTSESHHLLTDGSTTSKSGSSVPPPLPNTTPPASPPSSVKGLLDNVVDSSWVDSSDDQSFTDLDAIINQIRQREADSDVPLIQVSVDCSTPKSTRSGRPQPLLLNPQSENDYSDARPKSPVTVQEWVAALPFPSNEPQEEATNELSNENLWKQ